MVHEKIDKYFQSKSAIVFSILQWSVYKFNRITDNLKEGISLNEKVSLL